MKKWIGSKPSFCNICGNSIKDVFIDGATTLGPWGILCPKCHLAYDLGLGQGRGQCYELKNNQWIKKEF